MLRVVFAAARRLTLTLMVLFAPLTKRRRPGHVVARAGAAAVVLGGPDPARVVVQVDGFAAATVGVRRLGPARGARHGVAVRWRLFPRGVEVGAGGYDDAGGLRGHHTGFYHHHHKPPPSPLHPRRQDELSWVAGHSSNAITEMAFLMAPVLGRLECV